MGVKGGCESAVSSQLVALGLAENFQAIWAEEDSPRDEKID